MKKRILITDDDVGIRELFTLILQRAGYTTEAFASGRRLLENQFQQPDILLLDNQLDGTDGLSICRHLKSQAHTRDIIIIMTSATPGIERLARQAGADDFLEKPFVAQALLDIVAKYAGAAV